MPELIITRTESSEVGMPILFSTQGSMDLILRAEGSEALSDFLFSATLTLDIGIELSFSWEGLLSHEMPTPELIRPHSEHLLEKIEAQSLMNGHVAFFVSH